MFTTALNVNYVLQEMTAKQNKKEMLENDALINTDKSNDIFTGCAITTSVKIWRNWAISLSLISKDIVAHILHKQAKIHTKQHVFHLLWLLLQYQYPA